MPRSKQDAIRLIIKELSSDYIKQKKICNTFAAVDNWEKSKQLYIADYITKFCSFTDKSHIEKETEKELSSYVKILKEDIESDFEKETEKTESKLKSLQNKVDSVRIMLDKKKDILTEKLIKDYTELVRQGTNQQEALDALIFDRKSSATHKDMDVATKETIKYFEDNKDIMKSLSDITGINDEEGSTKDLKRVIDRFLKDQLKEKTNLTLKNRMAKEGGGLTSLPAVAGSYGKQWGEKSRKILSKMFGGTLEKMYDAPIEAMKAAYRKELENRTGDKALDENAMISELSDYENKVRTILTKKNMNQKALSEEDLRMASDQAKGYKGFENPEPLQAEPQQLEDGGTADDVIIKDGKVTKIRKDDAVMAGTDLDGKKDESKKAIIKSEQHLAKLSVVISDMFEYQQEKDEDDALKRDKLLADSGSKGDKSGSLSENAKELSKDDSSSNGFMAGMAKKALSAVAPFLVTAAGVAIVGAAAYGAYKLTKGAVEQGMKASGQINDMKEQQYSAMNKRGVNTFDIREKTEDLDASELAKVQMANLQAKKVNNLEEELKKENLSKEEKEKLEKQKKDAEEKLTKLDKELADISEDALEARKLLTAEEQKAIIGQKALNEQNDAIKSGKFKGGGELSKEDSEAMKSFGGIDSLSSTKGDGLGNLASGKLFNSKLKQVLNSISEYNRNLKSAQGGTPEERALAIGNLRIMAMAISTGKQGLWKESEGDYKDLLNDKGFPEGFKQYLKIEQDRKDAPTPDTMSQYQNMKAFAKGSGKNYAVVGENGAEIIDTDNNQVFSPLGPKEHERGLTSIIKKAFKEYINEETIFNPSNAKKQSTEEYERTITPLQKTLASKQKESAKNNINTTVVSGSSQQPIERKIKVPFEVDFVRY